ncbi:MAG: GH25 family lysozyme [Lachnospiraceae bacterium]|nr:GH25 family lysozyme [Lachnospiraceae bacterium]
MEQRIQKIKKTRKTRKNKAWRMTAAALGMALFCQPFSALAGEWDRVGNAYQMPDGTLINGVFSRGIDVSYWQQDIDWNQVAADDVDFVMLATRFRGQVDPYFDSNAREAREAGLELGAYIYSYATSVEMAEQEADFVLELIKDYPISYPVVFDAENNDTLGTLSPYEVSRVINAFCKKIKDAGYYPMVYANEYWLNNKIDLSQLNYDIWVARYNTMYTFQNPKMWQATNTGSVNGISGNVDINFLFTDYSQIIPANTWRTIGGNTYYYQNDEMQKSAWIHDGNGYYYMDAQGSPAKGWLNMPEGSYYLDEEKGQMVYGWKELEGSWRYFKQSGLMATGWREVDGSWYYMDEQGRMQTGWQELGGKRYYLSDSGVMQSGWQDLNGVRYYLDGSGAVTYGWQNVDGAWYYLDRFGVMQTGWQNINGAFYYLNESGVMQTGWQNVNGAYYYLDGSGMMQSGWQEIDGALYYLDQTSGQLVVNAVLDYNGVQVQADANGVCTAVPAEGSTEAEAGAENGNLAGEAPASGAQPENSAGTAGSGSIHAGEMENAHTVEKPF